MKRALILYKFGQLRNIFFYVNIVGSKSVENILENFGFDVSVSNEATLADAGGKIREVKFWDDDTVCYWFFPGKSGFVVLGELVIAFE